MVGFHQQIGVSGGELTDSNSPLRDRGLPRMMEMFCTTIG